MKLLDLSNIPEEPLQGHSSKGDQPKWHVQNHWYKADFMGYESLAEIVISRLLIKSNVAQHVIYEPVSICNNNHTLRGCKSLNFKKSNEMLIPYERLHRAYTGQSLASVIAKFDDVEKRIVYTVQFIKNITKIPNIDIYLTMLLEIDAFFLNEDRHTNNLAVLRNEKTLQYRLCPVFDNGLALCSDLYDYPEHDDIYTLLKRVNAKPFDKDFDIQVDAAESLYKPQLKFYFDKHDVHAILDDLTEVYPAALLNRVEQILYEQMRKYIAYFH